MMRTHKAQFKKVTLLSPYRIQFYHLPEARGLWNPELEKKNKESSLSTPWKLGESTSVICSHQRNMILFSLCGLCCHLDLW